MRPFKELSADLLVHNDGSHVFAATLAEHNRNVRQFEIQFSREKRQRESRELRNRQQGQKGR